MGKNILIFSDGTGQRGGILFDECRSNIYKLYRATRCGPDSSINPYEQLTYYDPGIGTAPGGLSTVGRLWRKFQNLVSQATGLGLTTNIIECYTALLRMWEPGDHIFLFGFSRGAYTVRCVGAVIGLCGIPRVGADGKPLRRDTASTRSVAKIAVKKVYQHVSSPKDDQYIEQRKALSKWFRTKYKSENDYPYFIGVFDTVAAIASKDSLFAGRDHHYRRPGVGGRGACLVLRELHVVAEYDRDRGALGNAGGTLDEPPKFQPLSRGFSADQSCEMISALARIEAWRAGIVCFETSMSNSRRKKNGLLRRHL
jgi:hypothetical protein